MPAQRFVEQLNYQIGQEYAAHQQSALLLLGSSLLTSVHLLHV